LLRVPDEPDLGNNRLKPKTPTITAPPFLSFKLPERPSHQEVPGVLSGAWIL